jgi:hypothetical protein
VLLNLITITHFDDFDLLYVDEDIQRRIIENQLHLLPPLARSGKSLFEDWATACLEHELLLIEPYRQDEVQSLEFSSMLLDLVSHNIPERIQAGALYVLSKFADDDTDVIKQQLLERGVERIFGLLKLHTPDFVQRDACELIAVLASGSEEMRESMIQRFDALDTLIKKLSSKKADDLRCAAARALTNLCYNGPLPPSLSLSLFRLHICVFASVDDILCVSFTGQTNTKNTFVRKGYFPHYWPLHVKANFKFPKRSNNLKFREDDRWEVAHSLKCTKVVTRANQSQLKCSVSRVLRFVWRISTAKWPSCR